MTEQVRMSKVVVYEYLCVRDFRSPYRIPESDADDSLPQLRQDCACDNCYSGKDKLAMEILALRAALDEIRILASRI